MPRITHEGSDYAAKPTGVLRSMFIDVKYHTNSSELPNWKSLQDPKNEAVLELKVLPEDHDRAQTIYYPIQMVMDKSGNLSVTDSVGIRDIHKILEDMGLKTAGFTLNGSFVDEDDNMLQPSEIEEYLAREILGHPNFRMLAIVYKAPGNDGKMYFRMGRFLYSDTEQGRKAAEKDYKKQLDYVASQSGKPSPTTPPDNAPRRRVM